MIDEPTKKQIKEMEANDLQELFLYQTDKTDFFYKS